VKKPTYTHHSQLRDKDIMPGTLTIKVAARLAEVLELEAFQSSEDFQWYGLDEECETTIKLTNRMAVYMDGFRL
jgi:hypothetical protein